MYTGKMTLGFDVIGLGRMVVDFAFILKDHTAYANNRLGVEQDEQG